VALQAALLDEGAVTTVIAPRIGAVKTTGDATINASGSLENSAPVLFDAVVLADGEAGVAELARHGQTLEFVTNQYRHGKTILAIGAARALLDKAGIPTTVPSGEADPGILLVESGEIAGAAAAFIDAVAKHRHPGRETDPPRV